MTPERWRRIDDLFDAALQLAPAERESWLREACGGDEDLRAEVDRLLAGDERENGEIGAGSDQERGLGGAGRAVDDHDVGR